MLTILPILVTDESDPQRINTALPILVMFDKSILVNPVYINALPSMVVIVGDSVTEVSCETYVHILLRIVVIELPVKSIDVTLELIKILSVMYDKLDNIAVPFIVISANAHAEMDVTLDKSDPFICKEVHPAKADPPMLVSVEGNVTLVSAVQPLNVSVGIDVIDPKSLTLVIPVQFLNAPYPNDVKLGKLMVPDNADPSNALFPIVVTFDKLILVKDVQFIKPERSIVVQLAGNTTPDNEEQPLNIHPLIFVSLGGSLILCRLVQP